MTSNLQWRSVGRRPTTLACIACMLGSWGLIACSSEPEAATSVSAPADGADDESTTEPPSQPSTSSTATDDTTTEPAAESGDPSVGGSTEAAICPNGEYPAVGAFDLASGDVQWSACSPDEAYRYVIGASDDVVLVLQAGDDQSAETIALDADAGAELWRQSTVRGLGFPPGPSVGQGIVVVETDVEGPPFVMGVDASTGAERWRLEPGGSVVGLSDTVVVVAPSAPTGLPDPAAPAAGVRGVDRATGQELWTSDVHFDDLSGVGVARGAAAITDSMIAIPTGAALTAVDLATGAALWSAPQLDHPAAADGVVLGSEHFSPGQSPEIRALDASSGAELWVAPGSSSYGDLLAVGDGVAVVTESTARELIAYELATGEERWRQSQTGPGQPQLVAGQSVVLLWESDLSVLSTVDGATQWSLSAPLHSPLMNSAGANSSTVFVAVNSLPFGD